MRRPARLVALLLPLSVVALAQPPAAGSKYALLVGVRDYDPTELRPLNDTENDVTEFADLLRQQGYKRVVLMTQTEGARKNRFQPEGRQIREELEGLLADREPGDTVLIAFAGHGVQFPGDAESYFCPADARLGDKKTLIPLSKLYADLAECKAGFKLLIVDACRNDPQAQLSRDAGTKVESVTQPQELRRPGGVAALFSCSAGERAFEDPDLRHGVFFHYVIEGLKGKAALTGEKSVSLDGLALYLKRSVPDHVREKFGGRLRQMPQALLDRTEGVVALTALDRPGPDAAVAGAKALTNKMGMEFVRIEPGTFQMGAPESDKDAYDQEKPQHTVRITRPFYLGKYPVTRGQFAEFLRDSGGRSEAERDGEGGWGYNESENKLEGRKPQYTWRNTGFAQADDHPVVNVTWNDAQAFCEWLSGKDGREYRLPTEAEWEYAGRAGTTTRYFTGDEPGSLQGYANVADATLKGKGIKGIENWTYFGFDDGYAFTSPVGRFRPNPWGLADMIGNVWQWCEDGYVKDFYKTSGPDDPVQNSDTKMRVLRGGSWYVFPGNCRVYYRLDFGASYRNGSFGFRVCCRLN
jgi:formylglycine-generating enzyme required for sulfatase activity